MWPVQLVYYKLPVKGMCTSSKSSPGLYGASEKHYAPLLGEQKVQHAVLAGEEQICPLNAEVLVHRPAENKRPARFSARTSSSSSACGSHVRVGTTSSSASTIPSNTPEALPAAPHLCHPELLRRCPSHLAHQLAVHIQTLLLVCMCPTLCRILLVCIISRGIGFPAR